jgi:hypothetical protein
MAFDVRVVAAVPCYKRPQSVETFLASVAEWCPYIVGAAVYFQPEGILADARIPDTPFPVRCEEGPQMWPGPARNKAVEFAMEMEPDLLWISDDDIVATDETRISEVVDLAMRQDTGAVSFTRKMRQNQKLGSEDSRTPFLYIGNGILIRPSVFYATKFTNDSADEIDFSGRVYLAGYENYRTNRVLVIHNQGRGNGGGLRRAVKEYEHGLDVDLGDATQYGEYHPLIRMERAKGVYGGVSCPFYSGNNPRITSEGHRIHAARHSEILKGKQEID